MDKGAEEVAAFPKHTKLLLICVNETYRPGSLELYDAVRYSWKISRPKAEQAQYVMAVWRGTIVGVYEPEEWLPAEKANFPNIPDEHGNWTQQDGRSGFLGVAAPHEVQGLYRGKLVPTEWRHRGNPIRYVNI
jgi:hypothetical protein